MVPLALRVFVVATMVAASYTGVNYIRVENDRKRRAEWQRNKETKATRGMTSGKGLFPDDGFYPVNDDWQIDDEDPWE